MPAPREHAAYHLEVERIAAGMQLQLQSFQGTGDVRLLGQKLTTGTPAVLLFVGGTPELAQFTQGLEKQARQRYIVALADVNLQTLLQMGAARNTPIIATQPVPLVNAALPVVRQYRETLARLFDEPPTPLSLAGFIAARYTFEVLGGIDAPLTPPERAGRLSAARQPEPRRVSHRLRRPAPKRHLCDAKHDDAGRPADWLIHAHDEMCSAPMLCWLPN